MLNADAQLMGGHATLAVARTTFNESADRKLGSHNLWLLLKWKMLQMLSSQATPNYTVEVIYVIH
jgi:hypothetical protein